MRQREDTFLLNCSSVLKVDFLQDKPPFHTCNSSKPLSFNLKPESSCSPINRKTPLAQCPRSLQELSKSYKTSCKICQTSAEFPKSKVTRSFELILSEGILPIPLGKMRKPPVCCSKVFSGTRLTKINYHHSLIF